VLASSLTVSATVGFFNPLDCFRIKWQVAPLTKPSLTMTDYFTAIVKKDGLINGLWKPGISANIMGAALSRGIGIGFYPTILSKLTNNWDNRDNWDKNNQTVKKTPFRMFLAGTISGGIGYSLSCPFWLIKTRQQSSKFNYKSVFTGLKKIYSLEGYKGLFRGAGGLAIRGALMNGGNTLGYDGTKTWIRRKFQIKSNEESWGIHFIASINAALLSSTFSLPVDVLLTTYQTSLLTEKNLIDTFFQIQKQNGIRHFFRGWVPMFCRVAPIYNIYLPFYEQVRKMLGIGYL
jgi:hypothetical protein